MTPFNLLSLLYILAIIWNIKTASEYNSENNLYHIVFPMIYLFMLYKSTGYYSNSLIVFYFIKTIILILLPELSKDILCTEIST